LRQGNNPLRAYLGYFYAYRETRRAEQASRKIQEVAQKILQIYRNNQASLSCKAEGSVIDCILSNPHYKNDKERVADILVFLIAGHDTTAFSAAWTLLELARHPNIAKNARSQLKSLSSDEERLKSTALQNLIKESMRLNPVAAFGIGRKVQRDFRVDDTIIIPKGSLVAITTLRLHRNANYFYQPDEFPPDRWNSGKDTACAFLPFGTGARNCIGQALATAELHTVLSRLVVDYDFEIVHPGKPDFGMTLKPAGVLLKAKRL
jgi:cytochrome P450